MLEAGLVHVKMLCLLLPMAMYKRNIMSQPWLKENYQESRVFFTVGTYSKGSYN